jgi:hypothetical protein
VEREDLPEQGISNVGRSHAGHKASRCKQGKIAAGPCSLLGDMFREVQQATELARIADRVS